jgi:hypothetical protein
MLFLIKHLIRLLLLVTVLTASTEVVLFLADQYSIAPDTFWETFLTHLSNGINTVIYKLIAL